MSPRNLIDRAFDVLARRIDGPLMATLVVLGALSLAVVFSASGQSVDRTLGQARNFAFALIVLWVAANVPPQQLMRLAIPIYIGGLLLLLGVEFFGFSRNGAKRWLNLGVITIQPSEIMKIGVPLILAWYFHRKEEGLAFKDFLVAGLILIVPTVLIQKQPDLGTAILIFSSGFFVIFLAGLSWRVITITSISGIVALPIVGPLIWPLLKEYQRNRVLTFIDPSNDPLGAGYHITQSTIAIGSGGVLGKGWFNGTQSQLDFIPERSTDFILAVFGEEFGLVGLLLLLTLYMIVIGRGLMIAMNAPTTFSRLMAGAVTLTFFAYAFVNVGMVTGVLPVVGVPLPLISYGGTAIMSMFMGFGILMSISSHKRLVST